MKKLILYTLALLSTLTFSSCSDDDTVSSGVDREFMTMFRKDDNTGKGDTDPYNCHVENMNDVHLYWYGVNDCAGYEIKMALQPNVSSGLASDWENPDYILLDTIVGPEVLDMTITDLQYQTDYRFAIRTLSTRGEAYNSKWYGYGNGRQWADWMGLTTENRYDVPEVIYASEIAKTTVRINIDRVVANSGDANAIVGFRQHFNTEDSNGNEVFTMKYLEVAAGNDNPNAVLPAKWAKYELTEEDYERGYVDIDGLEQNSVYTVDVEDPSIDSHWDAVYNTVSIRMEGDPGEPILIPWVKDTTVDPLVNGTVGVNDYDVSRLDTIIANYHQNSSLAEGQIFYLEGGKTYYFAQNTSLYKGFTLATNPEDIAAGKGRAKVYLGGIGLVENAPNSNNFMLGRQPQSGESPAIRINIKKLCFEDIDFDCPKAVNFGQNNFSNGTGNYFANMYSNGMGVQISSFEMRRCSFQRMIRGFVRVQGSAVKVFENFIVEDCDFYNDGYYDNNGRGYAWIAGDGKQAKSNIFQNMVFRNNTFYDSPRTCMFTDNSAQLAWPSTVQYNITLENNTFVNFSTRSTGRKIFDLRYLPAGSKMTVKNNLFILTKNDDRILPFEGVDIRGIVGATSDVYFDVENNWSTNTNLTNGQIFSGSSFAATSRSFGAYGDEAVLNGRDELQVHVDDISPEELMASPNPPHASPDALMHNVDNLNGLYYNATEKVYNSNIYKLGIGASKWKTGSSSAKRNSYISPYIRR